MSIKKALVKDLGTESRLSDIEQQLDKHVNKTTVHKSNSLYTKVIYDINGNVKAVLYYKGSSEGEKVKESLYTYDTVGFVKNAEVKYYDSGKMWKREFKIYTYDSNGYLLNVEIKNV